MGRTQTFDTGEVVRAARGVFWKHGYEAASIPALETATGLRRSSIYNAFGSKRGLFDAAVASYLDEIVRPRLEPLKAELPAPNAILDYLHGLRTGLERAGSFTSANGCLLINTAGAPIADDATVRETVAAYRAELRAAIGSGLRRHLADLPADQVERLTETCTALVVAAYALTRVDNASALSSIDTALDLIDRA
ncbi:TetR/AcrR family transcriptional regulator [Glycomyces tritici]|uniref:TetR/AcrR family transcriptional regulator n=1 Tax=Glycomyces tritici TaxID=2665176 RepID=A0ABT7YXC6_9ACTN|nr:TetR/AcrR family transcriptional regulator [Glycomyces tritici]MDN3241269.1 TetR/AcrR family transcriptional regulator [Glycomyces tritici]MDN3243292.1 TetR/AcrR family transcriptional regulator [Glycomyces tritici]